MIIGTEYTAQQISRSMNGHTQEERALCDSLKKGTVIALGPHVGVLNSISTVVGEEWVVCNICPISDELRQSPAIKTSGRTITLLGNSFAEWVETDDAQDTVQRVQKAAAETLSKNLCVIL